jgi:hypothetical protein
MEDIIGFQDQIGALNRRTTTSKIVSTSVAKKATPQTKFVKVTPFTKSKPKVVATAQVKRMVFKKPTFKPVQKAMVTKGATLPTGYDQTTFQSVNPVAQSFKPIDLPAQPVSKNNYGFPRTMKIKNTPISLPIDIDSIQPPVDAGNSEYYAFYNK